MHSEIMAITPSDTRRSFENNKDTHRINSYLAMESNQSCRTCHGVHTFVHLALRIERYTELDSVAFGTHHT